MSPAKGKLSYAKLCQPFLSSVDNISYTFLSIITGEEIKIG
jgi:hypothetical protein